MQLPDRVKEIITILADRFPDLRKGDDDRAEPSRWSLRSKSDSRTRGIVGAPNPRVKAARRPRTLSPACSKESSTERMSSTDPPANRSSPTWKSCRDELFIAVDPVNHLVDDKLPLPERVKEVITILAGRFPDLRKGNNDSAEPSR